MPMMRLTADFFLCFEQLQSQPANDDHDGDEEFTASKLASTELTYTLAIFSREEGVP